MRILGQESDRSGRLYSSYSVAELVALFESADFPVAVEPTQIVPFNHEARKVEVGEVGFTGPGQLPIGSDNITDCVTVAVRDPVTGKIGYTHLNNQYDFESLEVLFSGFENAPLEVKILGANGFNLEVSDDNMRLLFEYLQEKEVNITAVSVMGLGRPDVYGRRAMRGQPNDVVIDPDTFELRAEKLIDSRSPEAQLSTAKACLADPQSGLYTVFDLTRSDARAPIYFSEKEIAYLNEVAAGKERREIFASLEAREMPTGWASIMSTALLELAKQREIALEPIVAALDLELEALGIADNAELRSEALAVLKRAPLYVGDESGVRIANQPLLDMVADGLIVGEAESYSVNPDALDRLVYPSVEAFELVADHQGVVGVDIAVTDRSRDVPVEV